MKAQTEKPMYMYAKKPDNDEKKVSKTCHNDICNNTFISSGKYQILCERCKRRYRYS